LPLAPPPERIDRMKLRSSLRIASAGTALVLLGACAMFQKPVEPALVGTWTNSLGSVWMINADGTFDVDLDQNGKRDGWGTWRAAGDEVTLQRTGGIKPKGCGGKGVYHFAHSADTLQFTLVSDACKLRKKNVLLAWHRK
jgi:hypothetical protein